MCMCTHLNVHVFRSPRGARPGTCMMDRGGQLIAPLLTDIHTHTYSHTHTHRVHTCLTPVPHGDLPAPEAIAPETSKAQNYSAHQQIHVKFEKGKNFQTL